MSPLVQRVRAESPGELRARLVAGHAVDPAALDGWAYRGTSLTLPRLVERLTWKTFQKTFSRDPVTGCLRGWNVRLEQDGVDAPSRPKLKRGVPVTRWPYAVTTPHAVAMPAGFDRGLVIDYGPWKRVRDPLVALEAGSADLLLGVSVVVLGPRFLETPTWFLLEREHRLSHVPEAELPFARFERRWAEALFDALLGVPTSDRAAFWRTLAAATPPYFLPGLRAAVHGLTFLPLTLAGFRRPFFALSPGQQLACVERLSDHPALSVRQLVSTVKLVASLALFEDENVRRRFSGGVTT